LPLVSLTLGDQALAMSVLLLAIIMPLYNVLAVLALTVPVAGAGPVRWSRIGAEIATNPLIIAIAVGVVLALLPFSLPSFALRTIKYLGQLTFPLGLLGIGAGITAASVRATMKLTVFASIAKTALLPAACCATAWALGAENRTIAALFLVAGAPTAISSFIMAKAMDGDAELAGAIVGVSTACSAATLPAAILVMRLTGVV
jgi:predicted permease